MSVRRKKQAMNAPKEIEERNETRRYRADYSSNARSLASPDSHPVWQAGALLATFLPNDGPESALARLMVAATHAAMDCFARANSDASEVRDLELNYAAKLSLVAAALGKAFDQHRASKKEDFIDDTLPIERCRKIRTKEPSKPAQPQSSGERSDRSTKKKD